MRGILPPGDGLGGGVADRPSDPTPGHDYLVWRGGGIGAGSCLWLKWEVGRSIHARGWRAGWRAGNELPRSAHVEKGISEKFHPAICDGYSTRRGNNAISHDYTATTTTTTLPSHPPSTSLVNQNPHPTKFTVRPPLTTTTLFHPPPPPSSPPPLSFRFCNHRPPSSVPAI